MHNLKHTLARQSIFFLLLLSPALAPAAETLVAQGLTEPVCDVILSPAVPGLVSAWKFQKGDFVQQNQVLMELDNSIEQLEEARRKYVVEDRRKDVANLKRLVEKNSISVKKEELEKAETELRIAEAEYGIALEQLKRRHITAPCSGYISDIYRDPGESCQAYQPVCRVVDTREAYFVSNVESRAGSRLQLNQEVKLELDAASGLTQISGKVVFLSPVVDPASGLMEVKVLFSNSEKKIRPGVSGRLTIP